MAKFPALNRPLPPWAKRVLRNRLKGVVLGSLPHSDGNVTERAIAQFSLAEKHIASKRRSWRQLLFVFVVSGTEAKPVRGPPNQNSRSHLRCLSRSAVLLHIAQFLMARLSFDNCLAKRSKRAARPPRSNSHSHMVKTRQPRARSAFFLRASRARFAATFGPQ